jgi:hypothetical protein
MAARRSNHRYPRHGQRLAPLTLRDFLLDPLPAAVCDRAEHAGLRLCDLDERAWQLFPAEVVQQLSRRVVERVAACQTRKVFQQRHFPRPPQGTRVEDLRLENRTRRSLAKRGLEDNLAALGDRTLGEVLLLPAFGPRCLVDLLSAVESLPARPDDVQPPDGDALRELSEAAADLASIPEARLIYREDARFARLFAAVDIEARTAVDLAQQALAQPQAAPDPAYAAEQLREFARRIRQLPSLTIEQELIQIFGATPLQRNREILLGYYGWEDGQEHTLTEVGDRYGITRERVRQICAKLTQKPKGLAVFVAPVMDRAMELIGRRLPCAAAAIEGELATAGLTAVGLRLEAIAASAAMLERQADFRVVPVDSGRLAVSAEQAPIVPTIIDLARKEVYFRGLCTVRRVEQMAGRRLHGRMAGGLVAQTVQLLDGFAWLDARSGWFRLQPIAKHGLPKTIDKVLSVTGGVTGGELRAAMGRNRRLWKDLPPENVLLEFCRQTPGVRVEGQRIIADPPRDWRTALAGVEAKLAEVLMEHGPIMERSALEDLCVGCGMNRFSFHAFVSWSPVIKQFGHSVYGLLGSTASAAEVGAIVRARHARRHNHRVLDRYGHTPDGKIWLRYRLSKAASTYAVITVPAALKEVVHGRFDLVAADGRKVGALATKDGRAWGLGAFLRQQGARINDRIVLTLDLAARTAKVTWDEPTADPPCDS